MTLETYEGVLAIIMILSPETLNIDAVQNIDVGILITVSVHVQ